MFFLISLAWGIDETGKKTVVAEHNRIRQMILDGKVPNQPRGKNIKLIEGFDSNLSNEGRKVSQMCKMNHTTASDSNKFMNCYMSLCL